MKTHLSTLFSDNYDLVVVGAGHAGCEAAWSAAMCGVSAKPPLRILMLTMRIDRIALMSCNPSIGGLGKAHLTREIDALGGLQALASDATGIQFRMLNTRKGHAVQALRIQCDKAAYNLWMQNRMLNTPSLTVVEAMAVDLLTKNGVVCGVVVEDGSIIKTRAVICTTGTFLDGLIHVGLRQFPAGRFGDRAAVGLGEAFRRLGIETGRLKTGTPARLHCASINWSRFEPQSGDQPPPPVSFMTDRIDKIQVDCHLGYTNPRVHEIIRSGLDRSPLYTGRIQGTGARYCPSIEDKVVRFAERERHQIFLEPEGRHSESIYPSGVSTSLPEDVQEAMLHAVDGLEKVQFLSYGYAIEYTYAPPMQLRASLETRAVKNLFFAGQINGTSGYEEAAAQGLMAGINASLALRGEAPVVLGRDQAYIGVLIDDLITMDHREPYRMFTSRAEHRLFLRQDNADLRLTEIGRQIGLVDDVRWARFCRYQERVERLEKQIHQTTLNPLQLNHERFEERELPFPERAQPLAQYLARPEVELENALLVGLIDDEASELCDAERHRSIAQAVIHVKYDGYIKKQALQIERMQRLESTKLPDSLDYATVYGLRKEAFEKLNRFRPETLGQAGRIAGVNATDLSLVIVHLKGHDKFVK